MKKFLNLPSQEEASSRMETRLLNFPSRGSSVQRSKDYLLINEDSVAHVGLTNPNSSTLQVGPSKQAVKLPKIRSLTLTKSYRQRNSNSHCHSVDAHHLVSGETLINDHNTKLSKVNQLMHNGETLNQASYDQLMGTFKKYKLLDESPNKSKIEQYSIEETNGVMCFCQQRLGKQGEVCPHRLS